MWDQKFENDQDIILEEIWFMSITLMYFTGDVTMVDTAENITNVTLHMKMLG